MTRFLNGIYLLSWILGLLVASLYAFCPPARWDICIASVIFVAGVMILALDFYVWHGLHYNMGIIYVLLDGLGLLGVICGLVSVAVYRFDVALFGFSSYFTSSFLFWFLLCDRRLSRKVPTRLTSNGRMVVARLRLVDWPILTRDDTECVQVRAVKRTTFLLLVPVAVSIGAMLAPVPIEKGLGQIPGLGGRLAGGPDTQELVLGVLLVAYVALYAATMEPRSGKNVFANARSAWERAKRPAQSDDRMYQDVPHFANAFHDKELVEILYRRWAELSDSLERGQSTVSEILLGAMAEGVLMSILTQEEAEATYGRLHPKKNKQKPSRVRVNFYLAIESAKDHGLLDENEAALLHLVRDLRNAVHLEKERTRLLIEATSTQETNFIAAEPLARTEALVARTSVVLRKIMAAHQRRSARQDLAGGCPPS